jgi:DNA-binding NarL/FixJ family response regulator
MDVLVVSADPAVRDLLAVSAGSVRRTEGQVVTVREAADGLRGIQMAWRYLPDVVIADEITSRAGAFALARDLKGADPPFPGRVIILLERSQDSWLARWSEADAWFVKPVNPFELADAIAGGSAGEPTGEAV